MKPIGLTRNKPLTFLIGEAAYVASHPYVPEREVKDIVIQVQLGNPNPSSPKSVMTFRLYVDKKPPHPVSEARLSERTGTWYLVPPGGGFSTVPNKDYLQMPITIPPAGAVIGWVGFCLLQRNDLTLEEAWRIDGEVAAVYPDGSEIRCRLPACDLPSARLA